MYCDRHQLLTTNLLATAMSGFFMLRNSVVCEVGEPSWVCLKIAYPGRAPKKLSMGKRWSSQWLLGCPIKPGNEMQPWPASFQIPDLSVLQLWQCWPITKTTPGHICCCSLQKQGSTFFAHCCACFNSVNRIIHKHTQTISDSAHGSDVSRITTVCPIINQSQFALRKLRTWDVSDDPQWLLCWITPKGVPHQEKTQGIR